jgi:flavin-dependent dehydrogenase
MSQPGRVSVIGGGPAGSVAALAALAEGFAVSLYEKSRFPRHKVCGEFLSPEIASVIEPLDLWPAFLAARPARITRAELNFCLQSGGCVKRFRLPEPAYGLSRFALDRLLLDEAVRRGAELRTKMMKPGAAPGSPTVIAHGRQTAMRRPLARTNGRLFGFKAHFRGPVDDAVEMFFFDGCYVGVSPVEDGAVNVCGLAPEAVLREGGFQPEALFPEGLLRRFGSLERSFDWLMTGPLVFRDEFDHHTGFYLAGDAMGFVDPFTGTGILSAMLTGRLAGQAAGRGLAVEHHNAECRRVLQRQYSVAFVLRRVLGAGLAESLVRWIPGRVLYRLTRPSL